MINRTRAVVILALLPLALLFNAPDASAHRQQQQRAPVRSIRGRAHNSSGDGIAWVVVRLLTGGGEHVTLTVTNNQGEFLFSDLKETNYTIVISAPGYQTLAEKINLNERAGSADRDGVRMIDLRLLPGAGVAAQPPNPPFTQNVPKAARDIFDRALRLGKAGRKEVANTLINEALKIFPDYFDAHFALSNELLKAGRVPEAVAELEQASRINPKDDRVYQSFGVVMMKLGRFEIAAAVFAEAARLNPAEPLHPLMRANALIDYAFNLDASKSPLVAVERNDALDEAERNLQLAASKTGKHLATVHLQMARLYQERGQRARAADELDQYLVAEPNVPNAQEIRAVIKKLRTPISQIAPSRPPQ